MDSIIISRGGQQIGTYSLAELRHQVQNGVILPTDYAWKQDMADWVTVAQFLAEAAPPSPPPGYNGGANYGQQAAQPVAVVQTAGGGNRHLDIGACISAAISGLKNDPLTHIVCTLIIGIASNLSFGILAGPLMVGYMRMLKKTEQGQKAEIGDLFKGFDDFVPALVAMLLGGIAVTIGMMFCFIPGLLIAPLVPVSLYLVAIGEKDGVNALKRAWELIKGHLIGAAICVIVLMLIASLGVILCFIGIFLTLPIAYLGMYEMSKQLNGDA